MSAENKMPKIWVDEKRDHMPLDEALEAITDEFIEGGQSCHTNIIDLRDACKWLLLKYKEQPQLKRAWVVKNHVGDWIACDDESKEIAWSDARNITEHPQDVLKQKGYTCVQIEYKEVK